MPIRPGSLSVFRFHGPIAVPPIAATVDVEPETLQTRSEGLPVVVFVALPEGFAAASVDPRSVRLCAGACTASIAPSEPTLVVQGTNKLKLTFDRSAVLGLVAGVRTPATVSFTVTGLVSAPPARFSGADTVRLL